MLSIPWMAITTAGLLAIVGVCVATLSTQRELQRSQEDAELTQRTVDATQLSYLLGKMGRLGDTNPDAVKEILGTRLADDLAVVRSMLPASDAATGAVMENAFARIIQQEKAHPDFYLSSSQPARAGEGKLWAVLAASARNLIPYNQTGLAGMTKNN